MPNGQFRISNVWFTRVYVNLSAVQQARYERAATWQSALGWLQSIVMFYESGDASPQRPTHLFVFADVHHHI